jgi:hypothetical protein
MKTAQILTNLSEEISNINVMQEKSVAQKTEIDNAEAYANNILRFVRRKEAYVECCGGMYYV